MEEKDLLLRDLLSRLQYGVKVQNNSYKTTSVNTIKGFNEITEFFYEERKTYANGEYKLIESYEPNSHLRSDCYSAPTPHMIIDWLLDEHNIHIQPEIYYCEDGMNWLCKIFKVEQYNTVLLKTCMINDDKPQAINAAIKYTLENLI